MDSSLIMRVDAPYTLNFLIYLQNIYLNQKRIEGPLNFPYFPKKVMFQVNFESQFEELWNDISNRLSEDNGNSVDLKIFYDESNLFYQKLLIPASDSFRVYNEVYTGFRVWWSSLAGSLSIERSVDELGNNLYAELTNFLTNNDIKPKKQLNISMIYDECLLADTEGYSYFAILSIKEFIVNKEALILKLENCFW